MRRRRARRGSATLDLDLLHDEEQSFDGEGEIRGVDMQGQQVRVSFLIDELDDVVDRNRSASSKVESFGHFSKVEMHAPNFLA